MNYAASQLDVEINRVRALLSGKINSTNRSNTCIIVNQLGRTGKAYMSQSYLADKAGVRRETVCKSISRLDDLIVKIYHPWETCDYWLTSWFLNNRHHFYDLIPQLRQISLLLLFSITDNVFSRKRTLYKEHYRKKTATASVPSGYHMVIVKNAALEWNEPRTKEGTSPISIVFLKKQQQSTSNNVQPLSESVMSQSSAINLIADAYGLTKQQEQLLSTYSEDALQYAVRQLAVAKDKTVINSPVGWLAKVASTYKADGSHSLKGKAGGHSAVQRNPGGHSPAGNASNLSYDERMDFASDQESAWEEIIDSGEYMNAQSLGFHDGYAERVKSNWNRLTKAPHEFPTSSNGFKKNLDEASVYTEGPDYEQHLDAISKDKSDPEGYKLMVRKTDYRRTKRV